MSDYSVVSRQAEVIPAADCETATHKSSTTGKASLMSTAPAQASATLVLTPTGGSSAPAAAWAGRRVVQSGDWPCPLYQKERVCGVRENVIRNAHLCVCVCVRIGGDLKQCVCVHSS